MKILILALVSLITLVQVPSARADDAEEVLRARAYIALADQLYQMAQGIADSLSAELQSRGVTPPTSTTAAASFNFTATEQAMIQQYNTVSAQALSYYLLLFGSDYGYTNVPPFSLPIDYQYLKRDAYDKWFDLNAGFLFGAYRRRGANLYAVNADFKKDILEKSYAVVADLTNLNEQEQRLQKEFNTFSVSNVSADNTLTGVQAQELQTQNYSDSVQTQIAQYQAQVNSLNLQISQEASDIAAKAAILPVARTLLQTKWGNIMNVQATLPGSPAVLQVPANSDAPTSANGTFAPNTNILVVASGRWAPDGIVTAGMSPTPIPVVNPPGQISPILSGLMGLLGPFGGIGQNLLSGGNSLTYPDVPDPNDEVYNALKAGTLDCDGNGLMVSDSESLSASNSASQSSSTGASIGIPGLPFSLSGGTSNTTNSSVSRSKSQGITAGFKVSNSNVPSANVGALIAVMSGPGLTPQQQAPFVVGLTNVITIPSNATGPVTLGFMQNDVFGAHSKNTGTVGVQLTISPQFTAYLPTFLNWFNKDCDPNPDGTSGTANCGFAALLRDDRIGAEKDPQSLAQSALNSFLLSYPASLQPIPPVFVGFLNDAVSASVNLAMANHDFALSNNQYEQTATSETAAQDALELSQQQVTHTQQLVETLSRQEASAHQTKALLVAGTRFYEDELANLERLKEATYARAQRYVGITIDSFNYLFLSNYALQGQPQPGFEGNYFKTNLDSISDQILQVDANDDLQNPNQGFIMYQLTAEQLAQLKTANTTTVTLNPSMFFCQGYGIEDQVRVFIEKVGYLLDIDPINEQHFFKNPNVRRMPIRTSHGNSNIHFDLDGNPIDYYLPVQDKEIDGFSVRVLTDFHSDYMELGLSNTFQRTSFRNTSYATDWTLSLLDTQDFDLSYLNGIKFVIYFTSTEARAGKILQGCLNAPVKGGVRRGHWR